MADFIQNIRIILALLFKRLRKNLLEWTLEMTSTVKEINQKVTHLPCLGIATPQTFKIDETDALGIGYGGILK